MTRVKSPPRWMRTASACVRGLPAGRYRAMNLLARLGREPFVAALPTDSGGARYWADLSESTSREVYFTGQYEPQETLLTRSVLRRGMTFVDVGANWGYFSLTAAGLVGNDGRVVSLEPDPRIFAWLERNRRLNPSLRMTTHQVAAGAVTGELTLSGFEEHASNRGVSRIVRGESTSDKTFSVRAEPLDDLLDEQRIENVDFLKMDVEGGEVWALKGLCEGLARRRYACVMLELHPAAITENGSTVERCLEPLRECGYTGFVIDHASETTRRIAYRRGGDPSALLTPYDESSDLGVWPHTLWFKPGSAWFNR